MFDTVYNKTSIAVCHLICAAADKMKCIYLILCSAFHLSCQNPTKTWTLKPNVLVLEVTGAPGQHPLSCLHSAEAARGPAVGGISWRKDGVTVASTGNTHVVHLSEASGRGNYSCHSEDGSLLNHTEVLIQEDSRQKKKILLSMDGDFLKCSAANYSGEFHCSWTWHPHRTSGKVALIRAGRSSDSQDLRCTEDSDRQWTCLSGRSNMSCSVDVGRQIISCLDALHCPYAEETQSVRFTVFFSNDFLVENYSKHFYLSEIVKPDKVQIIRVNKTAIEWSYPSSWTSPHSYFPLTFEAAQFRGKVKCESIRKAKVVEVNCTNNCWFKTKSNTRTVCIRAKDALFDAEWSEWSRWSRARVKTGKKNKSERRLNI